MSNEREAAHRARAQSNLDSGEPDIFPIVGENSVTRSVLLLTRSMVSQWNKVFHCEDKIQSYRRRLSRLQEEEERTARELRDLTTLDTNVGNNGPWDAATFAQELQALESTAAEAAAETDILQIKLRRTEAEYERCRRQMEVDWKQLLAESHLLEPTPEDSDKGSQTGHGGKDQEAGAQQAPAATGTARRTASQELKDAIKDLEEKERCYHEAQDKVHGWKAYAADEEADYTRRVAAGSMAQARTEFDVGLLRERTEAVADMDRAEHALKEAKRHACELGILHYGGEQESGFASAADDGYNPSAEERAMQKLDRARIEQWMDGDGGPSHAPASVESDEWESKSIDLWESASTAAKGKHKTRIDRWRRMSEQMN